MRRKESTITQKGRYRKGVRLERRAISILKEQGWEVIRSAGSHGPIDLVAYHQSQVLFIQVRANSFPGKRAKQTLAGLPVPSWAGLQFWVFDDGSLKPRIVKILGGKYYAVE